MKLKLAISGVNAIWLHSQLYFPNILVIESNQIWWLSFGLPLSYLLWIGHSWTNFTLSGRYHCCNAIDVIWYTPDKKIASDPHVMQTCSPNPCIHFGWSVTILSTILCHSRIWSNFHINLTMTMRRNTWIL